MRIDKTQLKSNCKLCGDRDETMNHIISECSKLTPKEYKTRDDWVGKVIYWERCKKYKFDDTNKWYMQNLASVLENYIHKLELDFDIQTWRWQLYQLWLVIKSIQTDHLISARRPGLIKSTKEENLQNCGLCSSGWPQNKTERKWKEGLVPGPC